MASFGYVTNEIVRISTDFAHKRNYAAANTRIQIKTLNKEQLITDRCVQSWNKAARFGNPRCSQEVQKSVQKHAARFAIVKMLKN